MVHPQGPAVPLARCLALGREGAAPPACGTQGTVCTRWTAGCKKSTELGGLRGQPLWLVGEAEGSNNSPSPNDKPRPRPQLTGLVPPPCLSSASAAGPGVCKWQGQLSSSGTGTPYTYPAEQQSKALLPATSQPLSSRTSPALSPSDTPGVWGHLLPAPRPPEPSPGSRPVPTLGRMPSRRPDATQCTPFPSLKSENVPGLDAAVHRGFQLYALQLSFQTCRR